MLNQMVTDGVMDEEDIGLFKEIDSWFAEELPWPPQCKRQEKVICYFKTENSEEMLKMIRPALWLLDRYNHPYYLVYTNTPGEIVYENQYQVAAKTDGELIIEELQPSWSPDDPEDEEPNMDDPEYMDYTYNKSKILVYTPLDTDPNRILADLKNKRTLESNKNIQGYVYPANELILDTSDISVSYKDNLTYVKDFS